MPFHTSTHSENERLKALKNYNLLESMPEEELDTITRLASSICNTPIAVISIIDEEVVWVKSGVGTNITSVPREKSFCHHVLQESDLLEVTDALNDPRFAENPYVQSEPRLRFYAGAPLKSPDGFILGNLCVGDTSPKVLTEDQKSSLKALSKMVMDQFELKRGKIELEETKNQYRKLIEEAGDIIYTCDLRGRYTFINHRIRAIIGYNSEEMLGTLFTDLITPEYKNKARNFYLRQFSGKIPETVFEFPIIIKSGEIKWVEQTVTLNFQDGKPSSFQGIVRDIHTRKMAEEQLAQVNLAKEQFLANMSHEIRTPLNAVIGFTELLGDTELTQKQKEFVSAIDTSGKNLLNIINDILDYSKIESGMMRFEKTTLSVRSIFDSLAVLFKEKALKNNSTLEFKSDERIPEFVSGDPTRLTQIIMNLVGNAIKFTSNGKIIVYAEPAAAIIENKTRLKISVRDSGIGIAEDKLEFIFGRFNQAGGDTARKFGGSGLGLSIVKSLVELQGGTISVESELHKGSLFSFILDFDEVKQEELDQIKPKESLVKQQNRVINILLAEDNLLNQKLAVNVLSSFGFNTVVAENGKIALELLSQQNFDLILMDMQMPVMDGYETTGILRKQLKNEIPIIAMTAHAMADEKDRCLRLGMNDYISKPFKASDLYTKITELTQKPESIGYEETLSQGPDEIDLNNLMELSGNNPKFIRDVLDIFISETPNELEKIESGIRNRNFNAIRKSAHTLKSSVYLLGLRKTLEPVLEPIERMAKKEKEIGEIESLYSTLNKTCIKAVADARIRRAMI